MTGIVFHEPMKYASSGLTIEVDAPSLILIDEINGTFSISDPTAKLKEINVEIAVGSGKNCSKKVKLPSNGFAGKSVILNLDEIIS